MEIANDFSEIKKQKTTQEIFRIDEVIFRDKNVPL